MGAASSGGSDNQVSGAEAVYTGGTTYSSRKTKNVNKQIAATNQKNRDDRRSPIAKIFSKTPLGSTLNKISNSKFVQDSNYKSRLRFAQKSGKFKDTPLTREFVLSKGFKNQLDGLGYSERNNTNNDNDRGGQDQPSKEITKNVGGKTIQTTEAKVAEDKKEATKYDERVTKKKGRRKTMLTSKKGITKTSADYSLGKPVM